ncbi:MAG: tetratricopeptide repeat protein [Candidatus Aquicultorales bacterium]
MVCSEKAMKVVAMDDSAYRIFKKGMELLESDRPAQAVSFLEKARSLFPEKGSVREALGRAYFNTKRFSEARREFEASIDIDPTNHYAHYGLGLSNFRLGDKLLAKKHLRIAVAMDGNDCYREALTFLR